MGERYRGSIIGRNIVIVACGGILGGNIRQRGLQIRRGGRAIVMQRCVVKRANTHRNMRYHTGEAGEGAGKETKGKGKPFSSATTGKLAGNREARRRDQQRPDGGRVVP